MTDDPKHRTVPIGGGDWVAIDLKESDPMIPRGRQAPADGEIEITAKMVEAGLEILDADTAQDTMEGWAQRAEVVRAIYRAMLLADRARQLECDAHSRSLDIFRSS